METNIKTKIRAKIKATGEIVDVVPNGMMSIRTAAYKTTDGRIIPAPAFEYPKMIDWDERRYEIAKEVLSNMAASEYTVQAAIKFIENKNDSGYVRETLSKYAVAYADELIKQLKGDK